jgi:hypothetical protein
MVGQMRLARLQKVPDALIVQIIEYIAESFSIACSANSMCRSSYVITSINS